MAIIAIDRKVIVFQTMGFNLDARNRSGGVTLGNREQIVFGGNTLWRMHATARIRTPAAVREWRRILWQMEGRLNALLIGPCDCKVGGTLPPFVVTGIPHDDLTPFNDNTGYSQGGLAPQVAVAASAGATTVQIYPLSAQNILPGTYIGFGDRLYGIVAVQKTGLTVTLTIKPKLREDITLETVVRLCDARTPMRFTEDTAGSLELSLGRFGDIDIEMIEVVNGDL
jgi:hypothetical protein